MVLYWSLQVRYHDIGIGHGDCVPHSGREVLGHIESVKILVILNPTGWLHVDIFRFWCFHSFEVYSSIDSSKMIGKFPDALNFNRLFLELNRFICN